MSQKKLIKKTTTTIAEPIDGLEDEPEKEEQLDQDEADIDNVLRSIPGGATTVKLYRMRPQGGRPKFLTTIPPEMFSESYLQDTYGGGIYLLRARRKDGSYGRSTFEIEGPEKITKDEYEDYQEEIPKYIPAQPAPATIDPMMMMKLIQDARREARQEFRDMLEMMKPQMNPQPVQSNATEQVFSLVEKIVPLIGQGGGDSSSPWLMALTHFKEPLTQLVNTLSMVAARPSAQAAPHHSAHAHHEPIQNHQPIQSAQPSEDNVIRQMIQMYLPVFINAAAKNADPEFYADMILDQVPDNLYPKLREYLDRPDCLDRLATLEPGIRFQQEWWSSLRQYVIDGIQGATHGNTSVQPISAPSESDEVD